MLFRAIIARLKLRTPLHVGTGESTETVDDLLRRDAQGRLIIPGTALAGALRSIATRLAPRLGDNYCCHALTGKDYSKSPACLCLTCQLFGTINPKDEDRNEGESEEEWLKRTGCAAKVLIYDAVLDERESKIRDGVDHQPLREKKEEEHCESQIRDGVGIDRVTGAAARSERSKFTLEILSTEKSFKLRIELDPALTDEKQLNLLAATLAEWQAGRATIGGRVSRGLGAFELEQIQFIERDLNQPKELMRHLRDGPPWNAQNGDSGWIDRQITKARKAVVEWKNVSDNNIPVARSWVQVEFTLAATGPFLSHDIVQAARGGFDHAPWLAAYSKRKPPILPGSSLRGVLRSQAERIARTLATHRVWEQSAKDHQIARQMFFEQCPACNPLTSKTTDEVASCNSFIKTLPKTDEVASCNSFIKTLRKKERNQLEQQGAEPYLCPACQLFGSTWNGSRLRIEDARLKEGTEAQYKVRDFVAIDRFTGGARDTAKFDAVVLWKPQFSVRLFLENPEPWELGWLALTLRDLHDALTTVGYGRSKGFGRCQITEPKLTIGVLHNSDFPLPIRSQSNDQVANRAIKVGQGLCRAKLPFSGIYQTIGYDSKSDQDWLALANGWIQAFNNKLQQHERHQKFAFDKEFHHDSYFTQKEKDYWLSELYPVEVLG